MLMKLNRLALVCAVLVLHFTAVSPAKADDFLDLVIDDGLIVPWEINNIAPGDSGVANVDIRNDGNTYGYVSVWIDGITDTEGENPEAETGNTEEPGELSQYLTLNISGGNISPYIASPDFELPVALNEFPQSSSHPLQLSDQPLLAQETIQIQWEWAIPPQTSNIIQGDSVSFNIHYMLTQDLLVQKPSTPTPTISGGGYWPEVTTDTADSDVKADEQQAIDTGAKDTSDDTAIFYSIDGKVTIKVLQGTRVISAGNDELLYIIIMPSRDPPSIPQNNILLSSIYDVTTFTAEGKCEYPELDTPVTIVIEFDKDKLPERFTSIYVARYTEDSRWVKLTDILEINLEAGTLTIVTKQLSTMAVFAEIDMADDSREVVVSSGESTISDSGAPQAKTDIKSTSAAKSTLMREILSQTSLAIAVSGTLAMTVLAYIERKRRNSRRKGVITSNTKY